MKLYYRLALLLSIITVGANAQTVNGFNTDSVYLGKPNTSSTVIRGNKLWLPNIPNGLATDNLLSIRNGRIYNISSDNFVTKGNSDSFAQTIVRPTIFDGGNLSITGSQYVTDTVNRQLLLINASDGKVQRSDFSILNGYVRLNPASPQSGSISVGLVESFGLNTRSAITFDNNTSGGTSQSILYKHVSGYDDLSYNPNSRLLNWVGDFRTNKLDFSTIYLGNKAPNTLNSYRLTQGSGVATSQLSLALYNGTSYKLNFIIDPNRFYNMGVMQLAHSNVLTDTVSNLKIDRGNNLNPLGGEIEVTKVITSVPSSSTRLQFNPDDTKGGKFLVKVPQSDGIIALTSDFATGQTIGANTTGSAGSSTLWNNQNWIGSNNADFSSIITNADNGGWGFTTKTAFKSALNTTLQDVTTAGNTTNLDITSKSIIASNSTENLKLSIGAVSGGTLKIQGNVISTNAVYPVSINSDGGNVGIGTTSPAFKLDVNGAINSSGTMFANQFQMSGVLGNSFRINNSGGGQRWGISTENTESSGDVGFDFKIDAYSNGNSYLYSPLKIKRSTGVVDFYQSISVASISGSPALYSNGGVSGSNFSVQWDRIADSRRYSASGNGSSTTITVAHGLSYITTNSSIVATANNSATAGFNYATVDATNIYLYYTVAPASGTNNLSFSATINR